MRNSRYNARTHTAAVGMLRKRRDVRRDRRFDEEQFQLLPPRGGRAKAVAAVVIGSGVSSGGRGTSGMGEDQPVTSNLTAAGRSENRRVEIVIRPTA